MEHAKTHYIITSFPVTTYQSLDTGTKPPTTYKSEKTCLCIATSNDIERQWRSSRRLIYSKFFCLGCWKVYHVV